MTLRGHLVRDLTEELRRWAVATLQREHLGEPRNTLGALHGLIAARGWIAEIHLLESGQVEVVVGTLVQHEVLIREVDELGAVRAAMTGQVAAALTCAYALALAPGQAPEWVGA